MDVFKCRLTLLVGDIGVSLLGNIIKFQIFSIDEVRTISRSIIYDHHKVVGVVLRKNGVKIVLYPRLNVVVERGYDETEG
jgi:uncharacterized membrane protein